MSTGNEFNRGFEPELFSALMTPHCSLSPTGFRALMLFVCLISFTTGIMFLRMGAWPVFGLLCLNLLMIWSAFRINFRRANAREEIAVTPFELRVRRVSHRGHVAEWVLNPLWVTLDQRVNDEFGIVQLHLVSRGRSLAIGSFLGPDEKSSFAKALLKALDAAKRGPALI